MSELAKAEGALTCCSLIFLEPDHGPANGRVNDELPYVIANVTVKDPVRYEDYRRLVTPTLAKYGGRFIARGGQVEVLEGEWQPARLVLLEFPSIGCRAGLVELAGVCRSEDRSGRRRPKAPC